MFIEKIEKALDAYNKAKSQLSYAVAGPLPEGVLAGELNKIVIDEIDKRLGKRYLLVEDGSVDTDNLIEELENENIKVIVYRQGASKPEFLNKGDKE